MLILPNITDKIQVDMAEAVGTVNPTVSAFWRDITTTTYTPGSNHVSANGVTEVDVVAAPAASTQRVIDSLIVNQKDTISHVVTIQIDISGTKYVLWSGTMIAGSRLEYADGIGFVYTATPGAIGYTLFFGALTSSPADAATTYFGANLAAPTATETNTKVMIPKSGTIKRAYIFTQSGTAGTAENWSFYVRLNATTDTLIQTLGAATGVREFINSALAIAVVAGDYVAIKMVNPTWATNPLTTTIGGYLYIE